MSRSAAVLLAVGLVAVPATWGQAVISARSGMVNYVEGEVQLAGKPVKLDGAIFPDVKVGQTLSTQAGHAEILLTPGVFLRLDRNTSFRMVANKLTDTQVEILSGSALVEADEILKDNRIAVKMGDSDTVLLKTGLYHFNADAGQVRTFSGKAQVSAAANSAELKGGRTLLVGSSLTPDKFNKNKSKGELYAWSEQRNYRLALANISAARGTASSGLTNSLWAWDPWLGMYTFLPRSGRIFSPFGISWYSPSTVWIVFRPAPTPDYGYQASSSGNASWQGSAPSSVSVAPSSNASTGSVGASSGSSSSAVAASAGASRGR
ncbi:MAG TPA: FecR domain-containing protein [Bryobacteraceae bacterium]|nr:FecR domain-containing protein [Bryobacteraceae bacterium]